MWWHPLSKHKISFDKGTSGRAGSTWITELRSRTTLFRSLTCSIFSLSSNFQMTSGPPEFHGFFYHNENIHFQTHFRIMNPSQCALCIWSDAENICDHFQTSATVLSRFHRCLRISYYSQICFLLQKSRLIALPD